MCLYELISLKTRNPKFKLNRDKHGWYGWKVYDSQTKDFLYPMNYGQHQVMGQWMNAEDCSSPCNIIILDNCCYPSGFHVYVNRPSWFSYSSEHDKKVCRKVYIKQIIAKGYEYDNKRMPVIVCNKIFIPKRKPRRR